MDKYAIGVDLGGTNCRFGVVSVDGEILHQETVPIGSDRSQDGIINLLKEIISYPFSPPPLEGEGRGGGCEIRDTRYEIRGVGIGAPGIVDFDRGIVLSSPHYPDWHNFPLRGELSRACGLPVVLDNDANMVALGEASYGAGRGLKNFIMMTLGTGIGGGIVLDGKVFRGDSGFAGEIGHQVILFDGARCECGGRGCLETIISIGGLKWLVTSSDDPRRQSFVASFHGDIDEITPKVLHELAKEGDIFASLIWKKFGAYLGAGIASLVNITGIFNIVIGGGIGNAWDFFVGETKKEVARRTYKETSERIVLKKAGLGNDAGILGAATSLFVFCKSL